MIAEKDYAGREYQGSRDNQEDYYAFYDFPAAEKKQADQLLAVLADGMGGHAAGDVASKQAVHAFIEFFASTSLSLKKRNKLALEKANQALKEQIEQDPRKQGMGCTLIGVFISSGSISWISVGDSLLYRYREGGLTRLNADHSMLPLLEEEVQQGLLRPEEFQGHPDRNALRSALSGEEIELMDQPKQAVPIAEGDVFILASDGLLTLKESELSSIISRAKENGAGAVADGLIKEVAAYKKPNQDNATVLVIAPYKGAAGQKDQVPKKKSKWRFRLLLGILAASLLWFCFEYWPK